MPLLAIGTLLTCGAALGTLICGWACPFGFLQDLLGRVPVPKLRLPTAFTGLRFAVLVGLVLVVPYFCGSGDWFFICRLCPAGRSRPPCRTAFSRRWTPAARPSLADRRQVVHPGGLLRQRDFRVAAVVYAVLPAGGDFQPVQLRLVHRSCGSSRACATTANVAAILCKYRGPAERRGSDLRCIRCLECTRCRALSIGTVLQPMPTASFSGAGLEYRPAEESVKPRSGGENP